MLLSGHKACVPVLGYITEGHGETILNQFNQIPDGLRDFVEEYAAYSQFCFDSISELEPLSDWEALQTYDRDMEIHRVVEPLTKSEWGQSQTRLRYYHPNANGHGSVFFSEKINHAYNNSILDTCQDCGDAIYSPAGCPAIAMAQIMYYWKYPVYMEDSIKQYDWCNMIDDLGNYVNMGTIEPTYAEYLFATHRDAIAMLIFDCAERADTNYCASNQCQSSSGPVRTKNAFKKFGYSNVDLRWKTFNQRTWKEQLKDELDKGHPICYSAGSIHANNFWPWNWNSEGHTFICDGYNSDDLFHFNWGWNGNYQGHYYSVDSLYVIRSYDTIDLSSFHSAIFNIVPDENDNYCDFTSNLYDYYLNHTDKIPYEITPRTFTRLESVTQTEDATGYYRTIPQNAQAEYTAHKTVLLRDGFRAEAGSEFRAYITPCEQCETTLRGNDESPKETAEEQGIMPIESVTPTSLSGQGMTIHPNPNTGKFHITLCDKQDMMKQVAVFGILGNPMVMKNNPQSEAVDISRLPSGIYVVKVLTNLGNVYFEKIVKE